MLIFVGVRILPTLEDILHGDQAAKLAVLIQHREFFYSMFAENFLGFVECGSHGSRNERVLGHRLGNRSIEILLELQISVRDNTHQPILIVDDGYPRDLESRHEGVRLTDGTIRSESNGVQDHAALRSLHPVDFRGMPVDRHVLVNHPNAARTSHGDRHLGLGDGVHGSGNHRRIQRDGSSEPTRYVDLARVNRRMARYENYVIERQRVA